MQPTSQYMQAGQVEMQMPWYVEVLEDIPGIPTVAMVNANRTANTLMLGARKSKHVGQVAGMFSQTWNPMNAVRFSTDDFLFNPGKVDVGKGSSYTPYFGARMANAGLDRWGKEGGFRFEEGFLGRVSAASKLSNMSEKQFGRYARKATQGGAMKRTVGFSPNMTSPTLLNKMGGAANISRASSKYGLGAGAVASRGALMTGGRASGFMAGAMDYVDDASRFRTGAGATSVARRELGEEVSERALKGLNKARSMAKGGSMAKSGLRAAGYAGKLAKFTNPIGYAMLAYDITKLGVRGIGYAAKLVGEGYESRNRGFNTQIGGPAHVDTEASLTSRSRGVQAIQNSRLNARSVLGVEAGSMHSYYG